MPHQLHPENPDNISRKTTYQTGVFAEYIAIIYLLIKGYAILARRHKTPLGEIDIIAYKNKQLIAVEVKARKNKRIVCDTISFYQQQRIRNALLLYARKKPKLARLPLRIDAVFYSPPFWIKHFRNVG